MLTVDGKYASATIMIDGLEKSCFDQIVAMCNDSAFNNPIVIMPDTHSGKGSVIGFTMKFTDRLNPEVVGVDLGCGIYSMCLGKSPLKWVLSNMVDFDKNIKRTIPMGRNIHTDRKKINKIAEWLMFNVGEQFLTQVQELATKIGANYDKVIGSMGTLGGGNHFIELGTDNENNLWLTVHTGSRNFGLRVANYHIEKMRNGGLSKAEKHKQLQIIIGELKKLYTGQELNDRINEHKNKISENDITNYLYGPALTEYLNDMKVCQSYAEWNRQLIVDDILKQLERYCTLDVYEDNTCNCVESVHNYIDFTDNIIRKGAISSYKGEKVVIPFNMRDGLIIGVGKSNPDWNYSAPHGAGRLMSRTNARNSISMEDYKTSMKGVYSSCISKKTVDESPMVYKDAELIKSLIEPTVDIITAVKPIINIKAED